MITFSNSVVIFSYSTHLLFAFICRNYIREAWKRGIVPRQRYHDSRLIHFRQ